MSTATAPRERDSVDRIYDLTYDRTRIQLRLGDTISAINDLARMLEAVRYQSGLSKSQWERVERARRVAVEADQLLAALAGRQTA